MRGFPSDRKAALLQQVAGRKPDLRRQLADPDEFEQAIVELRREGFALIDLETKGTATTSVWYRKGDPLLHAGGRRPELTMLVQDENPARPAAAVTWRL